MDEIKKEEMNNKEDNETMKEKIHYEVRFIETEDGYRLEASGDKEALNKLGIGPNMLNKQRKHGRGPRNNQRRARRAAMARRRQRMNCRRGRGFGPQRQHAGQGPRAGFRDFTEGEIHPRQKENRGETLNW